MNGGTHSQSVNARLVKGAMNGGTHSRSVNARLVM